VEPLALQELGEQVQSTVWLPQVILHWVIIAASHSIVTSVSLPAVVSARVGIVKSSAVSAQTESRTTFLIEASLLLFSIERKTIPCTGIYYHQYLSKSTSER
jgi:hypothetical protein